MAYWVQATVKSGAFSVVVETANEALLKIAEFTEAGHANVSVRDLSGVVIEQRQLLAEIVDVGE